MSAVSFTFEISIYQRQLKNLPQQIERARVTSSSDDEESVTRIGFVGVLIP